jgi:hypothetical protein
MSFEEKNTWIFLVVSLCGAAVYAAILLGRAQGIPMEEVAYVVPMLSTVGVAIAAGIIGNIVVAIGNPREAGRKDVRDREIQVFGVHVGQSFLVIGGVAALGMAMGEVKHFWIAQVLYAGFVLSALLGATARLVAYRRGLPG